MPVQRTINIVVGSTQNWEDAVSNAKNQCRESLDKMESFTYKKRARIKNKVVYEYQVLAEARGRVSLYP